MTTTARQMTRRPTPGFTLIELLVVLGIIAILLTLSITVGRAVTRGGEDRITRDHIRVLDTTLTAWFAEKESKFPAYLTGDGVPGSDPTQPTFPIIDGGEEGSNAVEPTVAAYLAIAAESAAVNSVIRQQIDEKYLANSGFTWSFGRTATVNGQQLGLTVLDAWRRPIRFVHPVWHGGYGPRAGAAGRPPRDVDARGFPNQIRYVRFSRSISNGPGNADEGLCPGNRPYFYSAGRDGDAGTREDNIYTTVPSFPFESASQE